MVHELAHGLVARAHRIGVKNTGLVFLGPIIGAFVEPDEKKLRKQNDIKQYSVLAAGSFSNILLALVALLFLSYAFFPLQQAMVEPTGFTFEEYYNESFPAAQINLPPQTLIQGLNGQPLSDFTQFNQKISCFSPGQNITLNTPQKNYSLTLASNPDDPEKPFLGIKNIKNQFAIKKKYTQGFWKITYYSVAWFTGFLRWLFILSLGIGLFNLLPLPIVDGGRMLQGYLSTAKGRKKGERYYRQITLFFLLILLLNLFYPLIKSWFGF